MSPRPRQAVFTLEQSHELAAHLQAAPVIPMADTMKIIAPRIRELLDSDTDWAAIFAQCETFANERDLQFPLTVQSLQTYYYRYGGQRGES